MRRLKNEFTFNYNKQVIEVRLLKGEYCAIFGDVQKPLIIEFSKDGEIHNGKISTKEGKFLSWLPEEAFKETTPTQLIIELKAFINSIKL